MHPQIVAGDTAWLLIAAALVMFMTPGLAFFYGGLVRTKNVLSTLMYCFVALAVVTVVWVVIGHTLAFGPDTGKAIGHGGWIGGLDFLGFRNVNQVASALAPTVPHTAFAAFQMMVAVFAPALIAGAYAERMKFSAYIAFTAVWVLVVYAPIAHWMWGGGLLGPRGLGALDFAGGAVVHQSAGIAGLAAALVIGRRRTVAETPHNVPFVLLGASILWFGWFGFAGGHAFASGALAAVAFTNTQIGAASGVCAWLVLERMQRRNVTVVGAARGAIVGLVAIAPAAGYVRPWAALVIGAIAAVVCHYAIELKTRLGYDDALDVFAVHWVGGVVGMLLTGVFAAKVGLVHSQAFTQLGKQAFACVVVGVWSFALSYVILKLVDWTIGLRVTAEEEDAGLDMSQHGGVEAQI